jgi:hypothetical protein
LRWQEHTIMPSFFSVEMGSNKLFSWAGPELWSSFSQPPTWLGMVGRCLHNQLFIEMESHKFFAWLDLKPLSFQSQPPKLLELQVWTTSAQLKT